MPFTPVEEVLTPPPDIDTSGWLTYRDDANGFELQYPPDVVLERDAASPIESGVTGTRFTFPVPPGSELQSKVGFIFVQPQSTRDCMPQTPERLILLHAPHDDFWMSHLGLNGAGPDQFRSMYYAASRGTKVCHPGRTRNPVVSTSISNPTANIRSGLRMGCVPGHDLRLPMARSAVGASLQTRAGPPSGSKDPDLRMPAGSRGRSAPASRGALPTIGRGSRRSCRSRLLASNARMSSMI